MTSVTTRPGDRQSTLRDSMSMMRRSSRMRNAKPLLPKAPAGHDGATPNPTHLEDAMTPDDRFLAAMGAVAAPVTVVTTMAGDLPHGTTVSAFASLSRRPPMVLVALGRDSSLLSRLVRHGRFGVNVLAHDQAALATTFASPVPDRFAGVDWTLRDGLPCLTGATAWVACELDHLVEGGDHLIALGSVIDAADHGVAPLVYHRRSFGTHTTRLGHREPEPEFASFGLPLGDRTLDLLGMG